MYDTFLPIDWVFLAICCIIFVGGFDCFMRGVGWWPRHEFPRIVWLIAGINGMIGAIMLGNLLLPPFQVYF